jgi:replicative DNA helicase
LGQAGDKYGNSLGGSGAAGLAGRSMPESLAAEAAVLGSMIIDPQCIGEVVEQVDRDAFYRIEHQMIFDALLGLYEGNKGDAIDAVLLRDELEKRKQLEEVGGVEYVARVMESVPSSANVTYYTGIVKDKQLLRETIAAASEILNDAYDQRGETSEKLDDAERRIFAVTDKTEHGQDESGPEHRRARRGGGEDADRDIFVGDGKSAACGKILV